MKKYSYPIIFAMIAIFFTGCYSPPDNAEAPIPQFPWPPPKPSAFAEIPKNMFANCDDLYDVNALLSDALDSCGYYERRYFEVPNGFALITRIEQINSDASCKDESSRWSLEADVYNDFNLLDYLRAVFFSSPGYFRVFVFIVSDQPFSFSRESLTEDSAISLLNQGLNNLPKELADILTSNETFCTGLIYEFEKPEEKDTSYVNIPGRHLGRTHLNESFILPKIETIYENRNDQR